MRTIFKYILLALAGLFVFSQAYAENVRQVTVGIFNNKPIVFQQQDEAPAGLALDVLEDVASKEGWQLKYVHGQWSEVYSKLQQGKIDILVGIAYSEERAREFHYTQETLLSNWGMVNRKAGVNISSIPDLQDKRIALMEGSIHSKVFIRLLEQFGISYHPVMVKDYHSVMRTVEEGQADAGVINRLYSLKNAHEYSLVATSIMFNPVEVKYASSKRNSPALLQAIDRHLATQKHDQKSVYQQSLARWLSEAESYSLPVWIKVTTASIVGLLLLVFAFNLFLRRQVLARTVELKMKAEELEQENIERINVEKTLRERENHYKNLVESAQAIPWELSLDDWRFTYVGPQAEGVLGYPVEDWYAKDFWTGHIYDDDRDEAVAFCVSETKEQRDHEFEYRMVSAAGEVVWIRDNVNVVSDETGAKRLQGYMFDITQRKQAELELDGYRANLEEQVRIITNDAIMAKDEAIRASKAKSEFLSRMSHELRTPLNAVLGFAQLLELEIQHDKELASHAAEIINAGQHLLELIGEILDLSCIDAGKIKIHSEPVELAPIVNEAIGYIRREAQQRNITIDTTDCKPLTVFADRVRFKEVMLNLLSNAVKYNEDNGTITVTCNEDADTIKISVIDTGIGLSETQLGMMFEPFSRLGAEYSGIQGTGIGMTIVKQLVELMHGSIEVESMEGHGSRFVVSLPQYVTEKAS